MGLLAAINLFFGGIYLLNEAIRDLLAASGTVIVTAGFLLALGSFVLLYLVWPSAKSALEGRFSLESREVNLRRTELAAYGQAIQEQVDTPGAVTESERLPGPM